MRNQIKTLILLCLVLNFNAQEENNLVLNPSFESIDGKLKKLTQINIAKGYVDIQELDSGKSTKINLYEDIFAPQGRPEDF